MADGKGCKCAARSESECGCDADWTPQELIDARAEIARLRMTDAEREAVEAAARIIDAYEEEMDGFQSGAAATLRGLLARCATGSGE